MASIAQFRPTCNYLNYMMFGIGGAAPHQSIGLVLGVRCSGVECHYLVSLLMLLSMSYFVFVIANITSVFLSMATPFELQIQAF